MTLCNAALMEYVVLKAPKVHRGPIVIIVLRGNMVLREPIGAREPIVFREPIVIRVP